MMNGSYLNSFSARDESTAVRDQLDRMNPGQPSVPLANRRTNRLDDNRVPHGFSLRPSQGAPRT